MTLLDLALVMGVLIAAPVGWVKGFLSSLGGMLGFVIGAVIGVQAAPLVHLGLVSTLGADEAGAAAVAMALVALCAIFGAYGLGLAGRALRQQLGERGAARTSDSVLGALTTITAYILVVWMVAGFVRTTPLLDVNRAVAGSSVVAALDRLAPISSERAVGAAAGAFRGPSFPRVFDGQREVIRGVGEPNPRMESVGQEVRGSVVKVLAEAPSCPASSEGSGWVYDDDLIATNAHVVAGAAAVSVQVSGVGEPHDAEVIAFDPDRDVAVLHVPDLPAPPLPRADPIGVGQDSVVVGFPENGPYTISPSRIRDVMEARGLDIYDQGTVVREIYSLRAIVRAGNSGGPLLDAEGRVVGMVFGRSESDEETGYALTRAEIQGVLDAAAASRNPVGVGECLAS